MKIHCLNNSHFLVQCRFLHRMSKIFRPSMEVQVSPEAHNEHQQSKSKHSLHDEGYISRVFHGSYSFMPFGSRSLDKLVTMIEREMNAIGAQKVHLPTLIPAKLLKQSGRWDLCSEELFKCKDRNSVDLCLAPTHEEVITSMVNTKIFSPSYFPLGLYQIGSKFRDEKRPRYALLRKREFIMKDLYTFDETEAAAKEHYEKVCNAYTKLFKALELPVVKVQASTGSIGGKYSHEFHLISDLGDNRVMICRNCNEGVSCELPETERLSACSTCNGSLEVVKGFELGHTFYLGRKYSEAFNLVTCSKPNSKPSFMEMGCYGLGVSRILAASVEALSTSKQMRLPKKIAPFLISVIPPKKGSKEERGGGGQFAEDLAHQLENLFPDDVVLDDRKELTIGRRIERNRSSGIPYLVVVGRKVTEDVPKLEVMSTYEEKSFELNQAQSLAFFKELPE